MRGLSLALAYLVSSWSNHDGEQRWSKKEWIFYLRFSLYSYRSLNLFVTFKTTSKVNMKQYLIRNRNLQKLNHRGSHSTRQRRISLIVSCCCFAEEGKVKITVYVWLVQSKDDRLTIKCTLKRRGVEFIFTWSTHKEKVNWAPKVEVSYVATLSI